MCVRVCTCMSVCVHVCAWMNLCALCADFCGGWEGIRTLGKGHLLWMLSLNPGPLWEQYLFLTTESSLQHRISWQSFYLRYDDIKETDFADNWKFVSSWHRNFSFFGYHSAANEYQKSFQDTEWRAAIAILWWSGISTLLWWVANN